jgi:Ca2+-binding RTX toxin-like protein
VSLARDFASSTDFGHDQLKSIENVIGGSGNDRIAGDAGANIVDGGPGNDALVGAGGNDTLIGGPGADTLVISKGQTVLVYRSPTEGGDTIEGFSPQSDSFEFSAAGFGGGLASGQPLEAGLTFITGAAPQALPGTDGKGAFLFDTHNHDLLWDADGSGSKAPILIADLTASAVLHADDLSIVA